MCSNGPPHMAGQKQGDLLEHTFSSYVRIRDVALKNYQRRGTKERSGERGSWLSVPPARLAAAADNIYIYIYIYIRGAYDMFPDFFRMALLLRVHTWNSSPHRSNLLQVQCTCCTVPTTSRTPNESPLVWACQWPSSQTLPSPQLSHNDSLWA